MTEDQARSVRRAPVGAGASSAAHSAWWDSEAEDYYAEHGAFLGDTDFRWGPEGWREHELQVLGSPTAWPGRRVLEIGGGAGQCARWLASQGAQVVSSDLSLRMLRVGQAIDARHRSALPVDDANAVEVPRVNCDGRVLPFADQSFDVVFTAYGVMPFVADPQSVLAEVHRVLRPGGSFAFSTTHPIRWAFPDDPSQHGLTATGSYFDREPYVEAEGDRVTYVEHHRTLGDWVSLIVESGLVLTGLVEPEWPARNTQTWGGWSPLRGERLPGTVIFSAIRTTTTVST